MDNKTKQDFILFFNQVFKDVVLPQIDRLDQRIDHIDQRLDHMDQRLERVENKLDRVVDQVIDHEKRAKILESPVVIVHKITK